MLVLRAGRLALDLAPDLGGSVLSFTDDGADLLRPTPAGAADVLQTACFPLVPYANRIAGGRFSFGGRKAALSRNMAGQLHPLHGDGWRSAWTVEASGPDFARLALDPDGWEWPWPYAARQTFRLEGDALCVQLEVMNLDDGPGPFGLGFHPYFPHSATARLTAATTGVWLAGEDLLPERWVSVAPFATGAPVHSDQLLDHCHTGWTGPAHIDLGDRRLELTASSNLGFLHIFAPPGEDFFCVEPVSHAPNAFNSSEPLAQGIRVLARGQTLSAWMQLRCER